MTRRAKKKPDPVKQRAGRIGIEWRRAKERRERIEQKRLTTVITRRIEHARKAVEQSLRTVAVKARTDRPWPWLDGVSAAPPD